MVYLKNFCFLINFCMPKNGKLARSPTVKLCTTWPQSASPAVLRFFFQGSTNERGKAIFSSSSLIMSSTLRVMPRLIYNPSYGPDYLLLQVWLYTIWTKYQFLNNKVEEYDILR